MEEPPGREGCAQPPPPAGARDDLQYQLSRSNNPTGGISARERQQEECLKGSSLNSSQGDKVHWVIGPYVTEASKAGSSESGAARGNQGPTRPRLAHRASVNTKQERAETLTQIVPLPL